MTLLPICKPRTTIVVEHAQIDDHNLSKLDTFKWFLNPRGYAITWIRGVGPVSLHQLIITVPKGLQTDHIDRNKMNNLESNLRIVTRSQNMQNSSTCKYKPSGHRGVYWDSKSSKWHAKIYFNGKMRHLGTFETPESAGQAFNAAEQEKNSGTFR